MTFAAGTELPPFIIDSVDTEAMKRWAVFLADPNPIHLDPVVVRAKGLGDRVINQGPINVAYMMNFLLIALPGGRIEKMTSRFLDNVYGGERLIAGGRIEAIEGRRLTCSVSLRSEERGVVNTAEAIVLVAHS